MSARVECSTQAEADATAAAGNVIVWRSGIVALRGSSSADLHGSSSADLYGSSNAVLYDSSSVAMYGSSNAVLYDSSSVDLHDSSGAVLYGSSRAVLHGSSHAYLRGSSSAVLYDSSRADLYDSSRATDGVTQAPLRRDCPRLILGPLGSRRDTIGVSMPSDGSEPVIYAGCWSGRLSDFAARVNEVYPTGRYGDEYRATIAYIRSIAAIPQEAA